VLAEPDVAAADVIVVTGDHAAALSLWRWAEEYIGYDEPEKRQGRRPLGTYLVGCI
jgi:hypothetical protein